MISGEPLAIEKRQGDELIAVLTFLVWSIVQPTPPHWAKRMSVWRWQREPMSRSNRQALHSFRVTCAESSKRSD